MDLMHMAASKAASVANTKQMDELLL